MALFKREIQIMDKERWDEVMRFAHENECENNPWDAICHLFTGYYGDADAFLIQNDFAPRSFTFAFLYHQGTENEKIGMQGGIIYDGNTKSWSTHT